MKKILIIYYSQTGQLKDVIDSILAPVKKNPEVSVVYEELKPKPPYPFPWTTYQFCDVFPESVAEVSCDLQPLSRNTDDDYDLIIIAYTVWYLSPSIPVATFLQSLQAEKIMHGRPVLTIIGCRNMWLLAQEKVKQKIKRIGAHLTGNIVLTDKTNNLVGVLTIAVWMLTGKKDRFLKIFPHPGISDQDIKEAGRFGEKILRAVTDDRFILTQTDLNARGAVTVNPALLIMEKRVSKIFKIWSDFIRKKGAAGDPKRSKRVRAFMVYLITAVIVLAPLAAILASVLKIVMKDKIATEIDYYSQNTLKKSA
jgi:flavodoxin